jgi:hypothetical protein
LNQSAAFDCYLIIFFSFFGYIQTYGYFGLSLSLPLLPFLYGGDA